MMLLRQRALQCTILIMLLFVASATATSRAPAEEYVNTIGGTDLSSYNSHGNALPLTGVPWGFTHWAPQTRYTGSIGGEGSWWYHPTDDTLYGIRATHQPSPWIGDYGFFTFLPNITSSPDSPHDFTAVHEHLTSYQAHTHRPYLFEAEAKAAECRTGGVINMALTAMSHGSVARFAYPEACSVDRYDSDSDAAPTRRLAVVLPKSGASGHIQVDGDCATITGFTTANNGGVPSKEAADSGRSEPKANYKGIKAEMLRTDLFRFRFRIEVEATEGWRCVARVEEQKRTAGTDRVALLDFERVSSDVSSTLLVELRTGTSLISEDQAAISAARELRSDANSTFEAVAARAKSVWHDYLGRVDVVEVGGHNESEAEDLLTIFYSSAYRSILFPRLLTEYDAAGEPWHWSAFDGNGSVLPGHATTDSGFWDAYRTVYQSLALFHPAQLDVLLKGWLSDYREGGWLPSWASPGYRRSMVGTMADVAFADAIVHRDVLGLSFDEREAYEAIRKDAFVEGADGLGRPTLSKYLELGYCASDNDKEDVSLTLNYVLADWAVANAARSLGEVRDAEALEARRGFWRALWDRDSGFLRSRLANGKWSPPHNAGAAGSFDQYEWGCHYTEGGPWQYRFYLPGTPQELWEAYSEAGLDMCDALEAMQSTASTFHVGCYGSTIHEMRELQENCYGQYGHNNQPVHHAIWMLLANETFQHTSGGTCAARGRRYLRRALLELHQPGVPMFAGDEDNGEMAAWYVLTALGLYSLAPSSPNWLLGSPLFARVDVQLEGGRGTLSIRARGNRPGEDMEVGAVYWRGAEVRGTALPFAELARGGVLEFQMTAAGSQE